VRHSPREAQFSTKDDLEETVRKFASDHRVLRVMCDLMTKHGEFDREVVARQCGASAPRTLKRFCDAGLIEKESRPKGAGRIYYTMPRYAEIRQILGSAGAQ
jgi:predicted transcriptional regulator